MIELKARAKLNLTLDIKGRENGLHVIDSIIIPIPLYDDVRMRIRNDGKVNLSYVGRDNVYDFDTALLTAQKIQSRYGVGGVDIEIVKRIPERAGMGGSSADAACVARGMERLYNYGSTDRELLKSIGSDVTAMYLNQPCRVQGTGDRAEKIEIAKPMYFAVLLPGEGVDTATCYKLYDKRGGGGDYTEKAVEALKKGECFFPSNALYLAAAELVPKIAEAKEMMLRVGFLAEMTGSGSAVFGYEYERGAFLSKLEALCKLNNGKFDLITF